jgi:hypothetical protein
MKFSNIAIVSLFLSCNSFAVDGSQFQYIELSKVIVSSEDGDSHGFGVEGKYEVQEYLYLNGAYQNCDDKWSDTERLMLGVGAKYDVNEYFIPFSQLDYIKIESEAKDYDFKFDNNQYRLGVGIAGAYKQFLYKVGVNRYFVEGGGDETVKFVEASFMFGKSFSVLAKTELSDNGDIYSMGARYHF